MKKNRQNKDTETNGVEDPKEAPKNYEAPEGYEERTSDIVGFWDYKRGPIHFIPLHAKAFDSHAEELKPSVIIVGHAVGAQKLVTADDEEVMCNPNDLVGVWYKPGMIRIKDLAGIRVFMQWSGEKDTGKVNPMTTFKVMTKESKGETLYLENDYRKKSKHAELVFQMKNNTPRRAVEDDDDEDFGDNPKVMKQSKNDSQDIPF